MKRVLLNTMITLLVCAILAVSVIYAASGFGMFTSAGKDSYDISMLTGEDTSSAEITDKFILPEFIGVKGSLLGNFGIMADSEAVSDMYGAVAPYISAALSQGTCTPISNFSDRWKSILANDNVIYVRFHTEMKAHLISMHIGETEKIEAETLMQTDSPGIYELVLVISGEPSHLTFELTVKNSSGDLYKYSPPQNGFTDNGVPMYFDTDAFGETSSFAGSSEFDFYATSTTASGISDTALLSASQPILATPPATTNLSFSLPSASLSSESLTLLGFTPANYGSYTAGDGKNVYVNTTGTIEETASKLVFTASVDGGIPLLREEDSSAYSYVLSTYTAELLLYRLKSEQPKLFGGDASLMLTAAYSSGNELILEFSYFFDNVIILTADNERSGVTVTLKEGRITHFEADLLNTENLSYRIRNYPQLTVLRIVTPNAKPQNYSVLKLVYRISNNEAYTEWLLECN